MTFRLDTPFGSLELPRYDCLVCLSERQFMLCTACMVMDAISRAAQDEWTKEDGGDDQ